ncbi:MAG: terpene cyclase/mutase family protein [Planctomycetes bacterium]|nr:terpene cyclase/mutase family protein [Planctomycetota bacterium]MCC7396938.1 terpene cyclase/mutase family protein [Planctomycetota bacterium]
MAHLDPTKIKVQSHHSPIWEQEVTFQDMMAERLRQAPWLILSAALHAVVLLLMWVLMPAETKKVQENKVEMTIEEEKPVEEPPPPPPPETKPEEVTDDVVVTETNPTETTEQAYDNTVSDVTSKESAFDSNQWNSAVGLGGGAGGKYGGRSGGRGGKGGGKSFAAAIDAGLQWLKNHQDEDGSWDCDGFNKHDDPQGGTICDGPGSAVHDVGVTGLALLAFLGDGSTMRSGPYRDCIKNGVKWLREQQNPDTGLFGQNASHDFVYDHAIAAYAMCEAYGLSQYSLLKSTAQKGLNYLESHRNPYSVWRYQPRDNDNDTSVTGWCIMAYESGKYFKLMVNDTALQYAATWLDQVSDPTGLHGYTKQGEQSSRKPGEHATKFPVDKGASLTAVGLFCRYFMGQDPKEKPIMTAAANLIRSKPPIWDVKAGTIDHYYWYYATYALYQMGGTIWTDWQKKLETSVIKNQHLDKAQKNLYGSWDPVCAWGEDGGRVYSTAILTLTLEAYYRYSRIVH